MSSVAALLGRLRETGDRRLADDVVEAMVTTETSFFRDVRPFDVLRESVIPRLLERRRSQKRLNIWSAACSSGQEPYSIALLLKENFPELRDWIIYLLATDVSNEMIARARSGAYSQAEARRGLSDDLRAKWFHQEGNVWRIDERIREMVTFSQLNLAGPWPGMPRMDLVLLRNVLIYVDIPTKKSIFAKVVRTVADDGYLLLGGSETTLNLDDSFVRDESLRSGLFRLKN
ncbi:MAG TPA: protein-glutamate O-methyltransferase CheR [Pirellulaceae bacterium]|nr:protein-glutamate O-methyltransferase CheR [Pirellulaceae bacterium]